MRSTEMQTWPGVVEPVGGGGVRRPLEVGVGQHDHRILAAQLEADRRERLRRRCAITFLPVATEPVNITKSTSSTSAAPASPRPGRDLEDPLGQARLGEHLGHQQRRQRRHLRGLQDDGVAGRERRDAVAEGVVQRIVPGADHADDAHGPVADHHPAAADERRGRLDLLVGEVAGRLLRPELQRGEAVGELGELGLVGRTARSRRRSSRPRARRSRPSSGAPRAGSRPCAAKPSSSQPGWAARAAPTIAVISSAPSSGTSARVSPVAGFSTPIVAVTARASLSRG